MRSLALLCVQRAFHTSWSSDVSQVLLFAYLLQYTRRKVFQVMYVTAEACMIAWYAIWWQLYSSHQLLKASRTQHGDIPHSTDALTAELVLWHLLMLLPADEPFRCAGRYSRIARVHPPCEFAYLAPMTTSARKVCTFKAVP